MWDPALPGTSLKDSPPVATSSHKQTRQPPRCHFPAILKFRVSPEPDRNPLPPHNLWSWKNTLSRQCPLHPLPLLLNIINNLLWGRAVIKSFLCKVAERASAEGFNGIYSALDTNAFLIGSPFHLQLKAPRTQPMQKPEFGFSVTSLIRGSVLLLSVRWRSCAQRKASSRPSQTWAAPLEAFEGRWMLFFPIATHHPLSLISNSLVTVLICCEFHGLLRAETCAS